jgi:hypothetical protein
LVLLSQDGARLPLVPTLTATLGIKGQRPQVGTWDKKGLLYVLAVMNLVTAAVHANTLECPRDAQRKTGESKNRRLTEAFGAHLRHISRVYPRRNTGGWCWSSTTPLSTRAGR